MAPKRRKKTPYTTSDGYAYITKRIVLNTAKIAGKEAATKAMSAMGYVITVKGDWLVRQDEDGTVQKMKRITA